MDFFLTFYYINFHIYSKGEKNLQGISVCLLCKFLHWHFSSINILLLSFFKIVFPIFLPMLILWTEPPTMEMMGWTNNPVSQWLNNERAGNMAQWCLGCVRPWIIYYCKQLIITTINKKLINNERKTINKLKYWLYLKILFWTRNKILIENSIISKFWRLESFCSKEYSKRFKIKISLEEYSTLVLKKNRKIYYSLHPCI